MKKISLICFVLYVTILLKVSIAGLNVPGTLSMNGVPVFDCDTNTTQVIVYVSIVMSNTSPAPNIFSNIIVTGDQTNMGSISAKGSITSSVMGCIRFNLDGTNAVLSVVESQGYVTNNAVGTNIFDIVKANNFILTAGGWDDLVADANNVRIQGTVNVTVDHLSNTIQFSTGSTTNFTDDHIFFTKQFPHSWKTNTTIYPHLHFIQTSSTHTNMWFMRYKWYNIGDLVPSAWTEAFATNNVITYVSGELHQIVSFPSVNGAGKNLSSLFDCKIYRQGSIGTGPVQFKQFDIHYQNDSLGSDGIISKSF